MNIINKRSGALTTIIKRYKISFVDGNPNNVRWQFKWKKAYYYSLHQSFQPTKIKKPEDSKKNSLSYWLFFQDILLRLYPSLRMAYDRRHRAYDYLQIYVLPFTSLFCFQFWNISLAFKLWTVGPLILFYLRLRDKVKDPDLKETYLRQHIFSHEQIKKLFTHDTIHLMDYDLQYDIGFPDQQMYPQFKNKFFRFCNTDAHMCTGKFVFGDVESKAVMTVNLKTMPIAGRFKFQVAQPYHFYDLRVKITVNNETKQIVLVDQKQERKKIHPFLFLI